MSESLCAPIACSELILILPDKPNSSISILVWQPQREKNGSWACQIEINGLLSQKKIFGEDSFQSLCLALRFAQTYLTAYLSENGARINPKESDVISDSPSDLAGNDCEFLDRLFGHT